MSEDNGVMSFGFAIDTSGFDKDKEKIIGGIESIGDTAAREGQKIQSSFQKIGIATAAYFSIQSLRQFASSVIQVRGEIEALEISFETLLGSKDKANELLSAIKEFAVTTPMTMNALASGAQTLLGFGIEAEKVMPVLQQIGDISMGDTQKFNSLTLAFAQASSAGKLAGQDFLQMVNAGFNPLNEMSKQTGKSIKQLKEEMENGQITTARLEAAFASATAEGGMFHGMLEKQSQGIQGSLSNLQGAWDEMLNSIGEKQQSVIVGGINSLTSLVNNYEVFMNAILSVAAAYGTYKAALMAVWAVEKARALADNIRLVMMFRKELGLLTAAQQAFNTTAWANPYVLLAAAIMGVCTALYLYSDHTSDAEKAQKALNDEREDFQKSLDEERRQIEECINTVQSKTETDYAQIKAYETLKKICPEITDAYTREKLAVADLSETTRILNQRQEEQEYQHAVEGLKGWKKALEDVNKVLKTGGSFGNLSTESDLLVRTVHSWGLLDNAVPKMEKVIEGYQAQVDEIEFLRRKAEEESKPLHVRIETQTEIVSDLQQKSDKAKAELDAAQKQYEKEPSIWNKWIVIKYQFNYSSLLSLLNNAQDTLDELNAQKPTTYAEAFKQAKKDYDEAQKKLNEMKRNRSAYTQQEYIDAADALKTAKQAYEKLGGTVKSDSTLKNEAKRIKELLEEIKEIRSTYQVKIDEAQLKLLEDGKAKRLRAIEAEKNNTLAAIDKEQNALAKKLREAGQKLSDTDLAAFNARRQASSDYASLQTRKTEEENTRYVAELYRNLAAVFETEEQRKISAIKNTYEQQRRTLRKDLEGGNITQSQYDELSLQVDNAEAKETEAEWLSMYGDYYQKRKDLQETWEKNLAYIPAKYQAEALKQMKSQLSEIDSEHFKASINWEGVFGNLEEQSLQSLQYTLDKVKTYLEGAKDEMGTEEIKDFQEAIAKMENEIASRNPFASFHKSLKDIGAAKTEFVNALKAWRDAQTGLTQKQEEYNDALQVMNDLQKQVDEGSLSKDSQAYKEAVEKLTAAELNLHNATGKVNAEEQRTLNARNDITSSYKSFATQLRSVGGVVKDLGGKAKNLADAFGSDVAGGIGKALDFMDEIFGATSDVISAIGDVGKNVAGGVESTVEATSQGTEAAAKAGESAISSMEKASVILAVITAAMQVATAIVNLFNNDEARQKEIDKLQRRIDQLQWELDNAEAVRIRDRYGDAQQTVIDLYKETEAEVLNLHSATLKYYGQWADWAGKCIYKNEIMQGSIKKIADYYAKLDYTSDKALGSQKYDSARSQLENLAEQQILLQKQIEEEEARKKTNKDKIAEYQRKMQENAQEMVNIINEMVEDIIGFSAEDIATELGDAFVEAFKEGEDAAEAWKKKVDDIVAGIVKKMLIQNVLEQPLGELFNRYRKRWFGDDGVFKGIDAVMDSMNDFSAELNALVGSFSDGFENLPDDLKQYFIGDAEREGTSRGIATASQESVDENNARLTTIQEHTYTLVQGMGELNRTSSAILEKVTSIDRNTSEANTKLDAVSRSIKDMKESVDEISTRGIKIKA